MEYMIQNHGFQALWNPEWVVMIVVLAALYLIVVGPQRHRFSVSSPVSIGQKFSFLTGLVVLYVAMGSPLHLMGHEYLFSAHMLAQAFMYMVVPPLLLFGVPAWLINTLFQTFPLFKKAVFYITHPIIAMLLFTILFSMYHFPSIFDQIHLKETLYHFSQVVLTISAFIMWWPITNTSAGFDQLTELRKIGYIFMSTALLTPVCALIIFASTTMYTTYADAPQLFAILTPFNDQQLGGIVMKLVQEATNITLIAIIFFKWASKDKSTDINESLFKRKAAL